VVSDQLDLSISGSVDIGSWSDSDGQRPVGSSSDSESEWGIDNQVALDSGFVFLSSVWNLHGDFLGDLGCEARYNFTILTSLLELRELSISGTYMTWS
jgi:hypothetical protein